MDSVAAWISLDNTTTRNEVAVEEESENAKDHSTLLGGCE